MSISDRLEQIAARAEAATEGPWEARILSPYKGGTVYEPSGYPLPGCFNCGENEATYEEADAEFIAASRTDVVDLVAALRAVLDECAKTTIEARPHGDRDPYMVVEVDTIRAAIAHRLGEDT